MADRGPVVWVVSRDYGGYDGIGPPQAVFLTEEEATQYAAHVTGSFVVHPAPLMRFHPATLAPGDATDLANRLDAKP